MLPACAKVFCRYMPCRMQLQQIDQTPREGSGLGVGGKKAAGPWTISPTALHTARQHTLLLSLWSWAGELVLLGESLHIARAAATLTVVVLVLLNLM